MNNDGLKHTHNSSVIMAYHFVYMSYGDDAIFLSYFIFIAMFSEDYGLFQFLEINSHCIITSLDIPLTPNVMSTFRFLCVVEVVLDSFRHTIHSQFRL